jgi:hypothetical protein
MKRFLLLITFIVSCVSNSFASNELPELDFTKFNSEDILTLVHNTVPEDVVEAFVQYTDDIDVRYRDTMRLYLLAVGKHESEWKYTKSLRANSNGTYDIGYLMLNEKNICDPTFIKYFIPKPTDTYIVKNEQEFYLATCINFFKYLYNRYGFDACYAYNAGERRYIENRIPLSTRRYKEGVLTNLRIYLSDLYNIAEKRIEHERWLAELELKAKVQIFDVEDHVEFAKCRRIYSNTLSVKRIFVWHKAVAIFPSNEETLKRIARRKIVIYLYDTNDEDIKIRRIVSAIRGDDIETECETFRSANYIII